jgi:hypothetical protein
MAFIAFGLQVAMLAWLKGYGEIISQTVAIFALAGLLWLAPFLPAILGRRR